MPIQRDDIISNFAAVADSLHNWKQATLSQFFMDATALAPNKQQKCLPSLNLSNEDLLRFRFLIEDLMDENYKEEVNKVFSSDNSTTDVKLNIMLVAGSGSPEDPKASRELLLELLYLTKKYKILKMLGSCQHKMETQNIWRTSAFRRLLFDLCENLVDNDVEYLKKTFWPNESNVDPKMTAETMFEKVLAEKMITNNNLDVLERNFKIMTRSDLLDKLNQYLRDTLYYDLTPTIKGKKCGLAVIFNHFKFEKPENSSINLDARIGTEIDEVNLKQLWESFNMKVIVHNDLTRDQVMEALQSYSDSEKGDRCKIFVCCILSHGEDGEFYASDGKKVNLSDVLGIFGEKAGYLAGKPKLFFIQACQGNRYQAGYDVKFSWTQKGICTDHHRNSEFANAPLYSDILIGNSTVPGFVSFRESNNGSLYIQVLTEVLSEKGHQDDILSLLTEVNDKLAAKKIQNQIRQMPTIKTQLRRKLKFERLSEISQKQVSP